MIYRVTGGGELWGRLTPQGSKNAALPLLFASLLLKDVTLARLPRIGDVRSVLRALSLMGAEITEQENAVRIRTEDIRPPEREAREALAETRASSYLLGAGVARFGEALLSPPGGCDFGGRPLDMHCAGLSALGARFESTDGEIRVCARRLVGNTVLLPYPSVGATVNILLAALAAEGETVIIGYAKELHVLDLIRALRAAGAEIAVTENTLRVQGGRPLSPIRHTVMADGIEVGTYLVAVAAAGGDIRVSREVEEELSSLLSLLKKMGCEITREEGELRLRAKKGLRGADITFSPYPSLPTDLHPQLAVLLSQTAEGGRVNDRVFRERYAYLSALAPMGLRAAREGDGARVLPSRLFGATVTAPDLRAGAAAVLAAHLATGDSRILRAERIARGYENMMEKMRAIGVEISEKQTNALPTATATGHPSCSAQNAAEQRKQKDRGVNRYG